MEIGIVGLGRMGANLARRLHRGGHQPVLFDSGEGPRAAMAAEDFEVAGTLDALVGRLAAPRALWVMVPSVVAGDVIGSLGELLDAGDTVIDGGNSNFREAPGRARALAERGLAFLDIGTSGGVFGLERGYCLMIGGDEAAARRLEPIFACLAPGFGSAERTSGRSGDPGPGESGFLYCGPAGSGHYAKMVHNGIEYGMMAAIAEGLNLLKSAPDPFAFPVQDVAELWRRGSVVSSWLIDLTARALSADPELKTLAGRVDDSGEGRWTVQTAVEQGVPAPVLSAALFSRFESRDNATFANRVLSAMRREFGGHAEAAAAGSEAAAPQ